MVSPSKARAAVRQTTTPKAKPGKRVNGAGDSPPPPKTRRAPQPALEPRAPAPDLLDVLAKADPRRVIALMLWKQRFENPEMAVQITEKDITGFDQCAAYLKVEPGVRIERPLGRPGQAPIPAMGNRRAVPGYPPEPPRPFVVVAVVEKGTENGIRPIENNEEDNQRRIEGEERRRARENATGLAQSLEGMSAQGADISSSILREAAAVMRLLARA